MRPERRASSAALLAVAGLLCASCNGGAMSSAPDEDPCAQCPPGSTTGTTRCYTAAGGGSTQPVACVSLCSAGPCPAGTGCVTNGGEQVCSPYCSTAQCPARKQCAAEGSVHSACMDVPGDCSDRVPCLDPTRVCDPATYACYPANGACTTDASCPDLDRAYTGIGTWCRQGFCRTGPVPPGQVGGVETAEQVPVTRPTPGESFAGRDRVVLEWNAQGDASIAIVFADAPASADAATSLAIWEAGLAAGYQQRVEPATAGHPWAGGKPDETRTGLDERASGVLYLLVQTIRQGALVRASALVPFFVGGSWPVAGVPCAATPSIPGQCASPAAALACVQGTCRTLCASHLDCATGMLCGATKLLPGTASAWYRACE